MKKLSLFISFFFCFYLIIAQEIHGVSKAQSFNVQKDIVPPILVLKNASVKFIDDDGNGRLDAYENANISFIVQNIGKGSALGLKVLLETNGGVSGLDIEKYQLIKAIEPGKDAYINIPIKGTKSLSTGNVNLKIIIKEPNGLDCDPVEVDFNTLEFQEPKIELVDGVFSTENGADVFKKKIPAKLNLIVQNTGQSKTDKITVTVNLPVNVLAINGPLFNIGSLSPGESYKIIFDFITTANFNQEKVSFNVTTKEAFGKYGSSKVFTVAIDQKLDASKLIVQSENFKEKQIKKQFLTSDVDRNVPVNYDTKPNRYALVIGNEDYSSKQSSLSTEVNVEFAINDATSFKNYLTTTLGFDKEHVSILTDATSGQINREIEKLVSLGKLDSKSELVFYYAGHGLPDDKTKTPYLIPVDVSIINLKQNGISLNELISKLSSSNASKITVFLDACFSGGGRNEGLVASRSIRIKAKEETISGNMVVFASSSGEERSLPYEEMQHGFFTYFLLKKLQHTKGNATYGELSEYIKKEVAQKSLLKKNLQQTPNVRPSQNVKDKWENWSFR